MSKENLIVLILILVLITGGVYYFNLFNFSNQTTQQSENSIKNSNQVVQTNSLSSDNSSNLLTGTNGMTLYTFSDDTKLTSNCNYQCAKTWLPYLYSGVNLASSTDKFSKKMNLFKRSDGRYQYAYGLSPIYYYSGDTKAGDTNGDGLDGGKWKVVLTR